MATQSEHVCPQQKRGMLPMIIYDALQKGNVAEILQWLENGGDVNAADLSNRTLVYIACEMNYTNLLNEVLKHPEVHINQICTRGVGMMQTTSSNNMTPLAIACSKGHFECVEAILSSSSKCQLDLHRHHGQLYQFIFNEANKNDWRIFKMIIEKDLPLRERDFDTLINMAIRSKNLNIVELLLQRAISFNLKMFSNLIELYRMDMWTSDGAAKVFKMAVDNNRFSSYLPVLREAFDKRDWNTLETLLALICNNSLKINISLAEAVVGKAAADVETMLTQQELDNDFVNGALLMAAIGGTTEEIFERLFSHRKDHSPEVLNCVLILASKNQRLELFSTLFRNVTFSYSTLVHASNLQREHRSPREGLIGRALRKLTMDTIPLPEPTKEEEDCAKQVEEDA